MTPSYWYPLACPTIGDEEIEAATAVLRSGKTTMGEKVEEFEEAFARKVGSRHAVMVNSGSSADLLIAFALRLDPKSVILPAVTWPTHLWAWKMAGCDVQLADVDGLNVTAETIADCRTKDSIAVSVTHLMGVPAEMDKIAGYCKSNGLVLTEDCCEALGSTYDARTVGNFGVAAAWSFFFSHHMTTMEGGMVTTNHQTIAAQVRTLRSHGWARHLPRRLDGLDPRYTFVDWGFNLRPTEVQAAIGLVQLERLDEFNKARMLNYGNFALRVLHNPLVTLPTIPPDSYPAMFGIPMFVADGHRDALAAWLEDQGVETRPILAGNLVRQPAFRDWVGEYPGADRVHDQGLYVGLHPTDTDVGAVAELVNDFAQARAA
jgi:CDP-4-dehydro-6-deoxyglucose reductase, E1